MRFKKRKIILLLDNVSSHKTTISTPNVKLVYFPPGVTSKLQPLDQGIIRQAKQIHRGMIIRKLISEWDHGREPKLDILDAVTMISQSWTQVKPDCIRNCFRHAGILESTVEIQTVEDLEEPVPFDEARFDVTLEEYYNIDSQVALSFLL